MTSDRFRERYRSQLAEAKKLEEFVTNSRHAEDERITAILAEIFEVLDQIEDRITSLESLRETVADLESDLDERRTEVDVMKEKVDLLGDVYSEPTEGRLPFDEVTADLDSAQSEVDELRAGIEPLENSLEEALDRCEKLCVRLGNHVATTSEYDPTASHDGMDSVTKAKLDDILHDVSREDTHDW